MRKWRKVWLYVRRRTNGKRSYSLRWLGENGRTRTQACGTDKTTAETFRRHKEAELNSPDHKEVQRIECSRFLDEFLQLEKNRVAPGTFKLTERIARRFFDMIPAKYVCDVTARQAEHYRAARLEAGKSASTCNKEVRHMRAMFSRAVRLNYIAENPFEGMKPIATAQKPIRVLSPEEINALLSAVGDDLRGKVMLRLLIETAARLGEVVNLEFGDIDLERGLVHICSKEGWTPKSRKNRIVYISPCTCELVRRYKAGTPYSSVFVSGSRWPLHEAHRWFKRLAKKVGVPNCSPHDLRRTVITTLAERGIAGAVAQRLAGHASITTTATFYTNIADQVVQEAVKMLPWWGQKQ